MEGISVPLEHFSALIMMHLSDLAKPDPLRGPA